jgi:hypothetical protein
LPSHQRANKNTKKNRYSGTTATTATATATATNVFYVDKASAVKNMRNKTVRNK